MNLTSTRPYLLRAFYEWMVDNSLTPYVLVDATLANVQVPRQYVKEGKIVLNISPNAVHGLHIDQQALTCNARFGGVPYAIYVPIIAIKAISAKENGQVLEFPDEQIPAAKDDNPPPEPKPNKPTLRVVK